MSVFHGSVAIPFVADIDVQRWASRAEQDDASWEQLRDATLLDFTAEDCIDMNNLCGNWEILVRVQSYPLF